MKKQDDKRTRKQLELETRTLRTLRDATLSRVVGGDIWTHGGDVCFR
jgi:hypothetical protein